MADIIDEVLNDEKYEKRLILFRKILPVIIILTIIIAVFIAGYNWYKNKNAEHNQEIGGMLIELLSGEYGGDDKTITALEDFIKTSDNRQAELAEIAIVSRLIRSGDSSKAMQRLEAIINNPDYYDITTSFARLLWIGIILDESKVSDAMQMRARDYLQYFANEDQPFFANAVLMKALFYKKNAQNDLAIENANIILKLKDASPILKEQARAILAGIK